jgi:hypothetical protein
MIEVGQQYENKVNGRLFIASEWQAYMYKNSAEFKEKFDKTYRRYHSLADIMGEVLERRKPSDKKFWMVKGNGPTNFKHHTKEAAVAEAERLAKGHPGSEFYVLEAICIKKASKMETTDL